MSELMFTYQTRLILTETQSAVLGSYAYLFNRMERTLYAEVAKGKKSTDCKNIFLKRFNITARQFNACRISLEGKIAASQASQELTLNNLKQQLDTIHTKIKQLEKKTSQSFALHQKKRRVAILEHRLKTIEEDKKQKRVRLCFGSKKLFKAQYYLEKNGFTTHLEWKTAWETQRNSEFLVIGSKDESAGNQTCTASLQSNGKISLRVRLPGALTANSKYLIIEDVSFAYGQEALLSALLNPTGQAITYRFKKDAKSWKVFVSTTLKKPETITLENRGVIGIDLNADHIAYVETDRFGNPIAKKILPFVSYGNTKEQLKALIGEICKTIVEYAKVTKKPLVIEKLDFQKKKLELIEFKKLARLLSSFAYSLFFNFLKARAYKEGVTVHAVNPAFTSIIGRVNYAKRYGLSIHLAAALCIARRYQNFSESPCSLKAEMPDGKGDHLTFTLPVRNRAKHVWHFWGQVKKKIRTVLAAHYQAMKNRSLNPNSIFEMAPP